MKASMQVTMTLLVAAAVTSLLMGGCGRKPEPATEEDIVVVALEDTTLMLSEVLQQIPQGLAPEDSVGMFRAIVESWLRRQVLVSVAEKNIGNMDEINRMVEDYRFDLIISKYLALMDDGTSNSASDRAVDKYLKEHGDSMLLEEPVVKGIYLKVSDHDENLPSLREWMKKPDEEAVRNLERKGLRGAMQYEYFQNEWHAWHEVAELVPYRFEDADVFLSKSADFETSKGGATYLIHITEYVPTGSKMPQDYARQRVRVMLRQNIVASNRDKVITGIYKREIDNGHLRGGIYDPRTGRLKNIEKKQKGKDE